MSKPPLSPHGLIAGAGGNHVEHPDTGRQEDPPEAVRRDQASCSSANPGSGTASAQAAVTEGRHDRRV